MTSVILSNFLVKFLAKCVDVVITGIYGKICVNYQKYCKTLVNYRKLLITPKFQQINGNDFYNRVSVFFGPMCR